MSQRPSSSEGPHIAGRDGELELIGSFLDAIAEGPHGLLFEGAPGIGKTTLWASAVAAARGHGYQVLVTRASEEEMPIAGVALLDLFGPSRSAEDGAPPPLARGQAALDGLRSLAEASPVLIAIDDLQWIDIASGRALRYALRRLEAEPVGLVAAVRAGSVRDEVDMTVAAFPPGLLQTVDVSPLDLDAIRRVLQRVVTRISRPMLRRIHEFSGGNPLYAIELARAVGQGVAEADTVSLPTSLQEAIAGRLDRAPSELAPLLQIVAAQGRTSSTGLVNLLPDADVDRLLSAGVEHGLLIVDDGSGVRFSHPLLGTAVYERMPPLARRSLHARLASAQDHPDAKARHLARSIEQPDERAASLLEDAARRARARGAHSLAAEFSGHSVRLTDPGDGPDAHRRIILQIDSLQTAGERTQALAIADRAIAAWPRGPQRAELLAVRSFVGADAMDVAIALLDQALHEVGDDVRLGCLLLERRANERIAEGDLVGGLGDLRSAVERSADVTDFTFRTRLKAGLGQLELLAGSPRPDLMDDAAGLGTEDLTTDAVDPRFDVARQMLWSGDLAAARERVEILRTLAAGAEVVFPHIQALYDLSVLECAAGDLASATMWAREGAQWARDYDDPWSESHFSYPLARIDVWSAPPADAAVAVGDLHDMADSFQTRPNMVRAHWLLGLLALREREIPEAASHLTDAVTLLERTGIVHPAPYPVLPDAIEALAVAGDVVSAQELLERLESQAEAVRSAWASAVALRARGALLLAHGDPEEALEPLAAAVDMLDSLGFQPDAARAVQARGSALLRIGHRSAAGEALSDARARFSAMGAEPWAAAATLELERVAPGRAAGELTATESRIAALVAEGRKNKEIAASLFMSVATVEAHLTRIYRKLGIGSRSDLTRLVATGDLELR